MGNSSSDTKNTADAAAEKQKVFDSALKEYIEGNFKIEPKFLSLLRDCKSKKNIKKGEFNFSNCLDQDNVKMKEFTQWFAKGNCKGNKSTCDAILYPNFLVNETLQKQYWSKSLQNLQQILEKSKTSYDQFQNNSPSDFNIKKFRSDENIALGFGTKRGKKSAGKPAKKSTVKPAKKSAVKTAKKSAGKPAKKSAVKTAKKSKRSQKKSKRVNK